MIYRHERRGRRWGVVVSVVGVWFAVLIAWVVFDPTWWIAALVLAFTLPAILDIIRDTRTWVEVWPNRIKWRSTLHIGDRADVDHVRLDRRFDGGLKITLIHIGGAQTRLPPDLSPPVDAFETALKTANIAAQRHPFSVF